MSEEAVAIPTTADPPTPRTTRTFIGHAKIIGALTLASRILGLVRDMVAAHYLGARNPVAIAFNFAFAIPNLFRKLFGEGALSAAFIPLYTQSVKHESAAQANRFAAASVTLLILILVTITLIGELVLGTMLAFTETQRLDRLLTIQFTMIMLPYVLLICTGAFLSGILQVHHRFAAPAAAPIILNVCHITVLWLGAWFLGLKAQSNAPETLQIQTRLAYWLACFVLVAGALQVMVLWPGLRAVGFRFQIIRSFWTPMVKRMIKLTVPVAMSAGVLQLSVLLDKGISILLMQGEGFAGNAITHFNFFGHVVRYPMELGAIVRLSYAQVMYQFPLGIFAIALATAIFPALSAHAREADRGRFREMLRKGIETSFWESLPASAGLILVAYPAAMLLFRHGQISDHDATLIARSLTFYSAGIWAFSLQLIVNRAYYALHDTKTPLVMSIITLIVNLAVEIPLLWTNLGEAGMAAGTTVSFVLQSLVMLFMLNRRVGGLDLSRSLLPICKMLLATAAMAGACLWVKHSHWHPVGHTRFVWAMQVTQMVVVGAGVYFLMSIVLRIGLMEGLRKKAKG
jgi:putative peptidoglycan lipid II flippase